MNGRYGASRRARIAVLSDARSRGDSLSEGNAGRCPPGREVSTHRAASNLLTFPAPPPPPRVGEVARERRCGLISNFASLLIKTHRPTLTVMLARKCSFPGLQRPRYTLDGRVTYAARYLWPCTQFSADLATHAVRGTAAPVLPARGEITRRNGSE